MFLIIRRVRPFLISSLKAAFINVTTFVLLICASHFISCRPIEMPIGSVSQCSCPVFLIRRIMVVRVFGLVGPADLSTDTTCLLFFTSFAVVVIFSIVLCHIGGSALTCVEDVFMTRRWSVAEVVRY